MVRPQWNRVLINAQITAGLRLLCGSHFYATQQRGRSVHDGSVTGTHEKIHNG